MPRCGRAGRGRSAALDLATDPVDGPLDDVSVARPTTAQAMAAPALPGPTRRRRRPGRVTTPVADVPVTCAPLPSRPNRGGRGRRHRLGSARRRVEAGSDAGCDVDDWSSLPRRRRPGARPGWPSTIPARLRTPARVVAPSGRHAGGRGHRRRRVVDPDVGGPRTHADRRGRRRRHKPEDVGHEIARVGGVDALAVEHLGLTRRPTTLTDLALPLASMDGRAATPERWLELSRRGEPDRRPPGPTDRPRPPTPTTVPGG